MAEQTQLPNRAEDYRKAAADYLETRSQLKGASIEENIEVALQSCTVAFWSIAAELAEANSRDREAEIRANNAEAFVEALQQEISRQQQTGLLIPGAVKVTPRGK